MCRRANLLIFCILLIVVVVDVKSVEQNNYGNAQQSADFEDNFGFLGPQNLFKNYNIDSSAFVDYTNNTCQRDLNLVYEALTSQKLWALQMFDASSKIPSGLLAGNMFDAGMYDECIAVRGESQGIDIRGRHCMYSIAVALGNVSLSLMMSICVPASCSGDDIVDLLNSTMSQLPAIKTSVGQLPGLGVKVAQAMCSSDGQEVWDTEFIVCFCFLIFYVGFLVICTLCDMVHNRYQHRAVAVLSQFSLIKSITAILNTQVKEGNLPAIHGIRFLAMAWVLLGHEYEIRGMGANINNLDVFEWIRSWKSLYIVTAPFSVDTFFALSGFLMTYVFFKQMPKQKKFNVPMYYLHRYFRLTPSVAALLVISVVFVPKVGSGAAWDMTMDAFVNGCRSQWWKNLLYIQNFAGTPNTCLPHLWYLGVDMQLFLISPLILYPLYNQPKVGIIIITSLFLVSMVILSSIVGIYKLHVFSIPQLPQNNETSHTNAFTDIGSTPYNRAGAWLIGIAFGFDVASKNRIMSKLAIFTGWLLAAGAFAFCMFGTRSFMESDYEYNIVWEIVFAAFSRPLWAFGVSWIIYASVKNCAGPISIFLSWKLFIPLSRISYCVYLVHMVIQIMHVGNTRTLNYFSDYYVWHDYLSNLVVCIIVSFFFSLLFESPVMILENMLIRKKQISQYESQRELRSEDSEDLKPNDKEIVNDN